MSKTALLMGGIPYGARMESGWFLAPASFPIKGGECPMSYDHWLQQGDDYIFSYSASWFITAAGVTMLHNLDLTRPQERKVYDMAQAGQAFLSYGRGSSPAVTRARVASKNGRQQPKVNRPWIVPLEHWAYVKTPAFPQQPPVKIIYGE